MGRENKGTEKIQHYNTHRSKFLATALAVNDNYNVDITLSDRNLDDLLSVWSLAVLAGRLTLLDRAIRSVNRLHVQPLAPPTKLFWGFRSAEISIYCTIITWDAEQPIITYDISWLTLSRYYTNLTFGVWFIIRASDNKQEENINNKPWEQRVKR